jgi:hypothetical protein
MYLVYMFTSTVLVANLSPDERGPRNSFLGGGAFFSDTTQPGHLPNEAVLRSAPRLAACASGRRSDVCA